MIALNYWKQSLGVLLALLIAMPMTLARQYKPFWDVSAIHQNAEAIVTLYEEGIIEGYSDGSFRAEKTINRAEFAKILVEATVDDAFIESCLDSYTPADKSTFFSDVSVHEWYAKYVCAAHIRGFVDGYPDGSFHPGADITLVEAAKIMAIAKKLIIQSDDPFVPWFEEYLRAMANNNAIPRSFHRWDVPILRGEMAEMLFRLNHGLSSTDAGVRTYEELEFYMNSNSSMYSYEEDRRNRETHFTAFFRSAIEEGLKHPDSVYTLTLQGSRDHSDVMMEWPDVVARFKNLGSLSVFDNEVPSIEASVGELKNLSALNAGSNNIFYIAPEFWTLTKLKFLNLSNNSLNSIPDEIGNLTDLETLYLNDNEISSLPDSLSKLTKLKILWLDGNPLDESAIEALRKKLPGVTITFGFSINPRSPVWAELVVEELDIVIPYPASWYLTKGQENETAVLLDERGNVAVRVYCPIPQVGFEAWEFDEQSTTYQKNGRTHGKTLWIGKARPGTDVGTLNIFFIHRNDFEHWYDGDDYRYSCMVTSSGQIDVLTQMYERAE